MATKVKEVTYGQLMDMIRNNTQPDKIMADVGATYLWDGLNYYRDGDGVGYKSLLSKYSQKYLGGMKFKYEVPPLDAIEKEYINNIIKPFKKKLYGIKVVKHVAGESEWITIVGGGGDLNASFPMFKKGTMYEGMDLEKRYTLEELGL